MLDLILGVDMGFKINNNLTEEDYDRVMEILSDKKLLESEEMQMNADRGISVKVFRESELELPLASMEDRWRGGQFFSSNGESYEIEVKLAYESRENNFSKVLELLKERIPPGYTATMGKKTLELSKNGFGYRASCIGSEICICTVRERKLEKEQLILDTNAIIMMIELVVNAIYEEANTDADIAISAALRIPKTLVNRKMKKLNNLIHLEKPMLTFGEIGGCEEAKAELTLLGHGLQKPESFEKWGLRYPRGILLHGAPGTGKTLLAKAMANLAQASLYCVSVSDVLSCYYGESPKLISRVFEIAQKNAPAIILFDEIDSIAQQRNEAHEETIRMVSVFLQKMDGIRGLDKVTIIGTTNSLENIDRALLRPGRFDKIIEVPLPDKNSRREIFRLHCEGKRVDSSIDYSLLAEKSDGFTGAEISEVVQMGLGMKLREEITTGNAELKPLCTEELLGSMSEYSKRRKARGVEAMENVGMYA